MPVSPMSRTSPPIAHAMNLSNRLITEVNCHRVLAFRRKLVMSPLSRASPAISHCPGGSWLSGVSYEYGYAPVPCGQSDVQRRSVSGAIKWPFRYQDYFSAG